MSQQTDSYQVGDKLIRFSNVYEVYKVKERENEEGETERVIYFQPLYETNRTKTLKCSIPESSVEMTSIRRPMTDAELEDFFDELRKKKFKKMSFRRNIMKKALNENEPDSVARVLKTLWAEKHDENKKFTISKRNLWKSAMKRIKQEVALIKDSSLEEAEKLIISVLKESGIPGEKEEEEKK